MHAAGGIEGGMALMTFPRARARPLRAWTSKAPTIKAAPDHCSLVSRSFSHTAEIAAEKDASIARAAAANVGLSARWPSTCEK